MKARQIEMQFRTWGGKRRGAGRRRKGRKCLPHTARERIPARLPAHVTLRIDRNIPTLRTRRAFAVVERAFWRAQGKFGMRLVHFSVQSNHIHLVVEGVNAQAMKGLGVRIARGVNRLLQRRGRVIGDTYHARALKTPTEVRNAVHYVVNNNHHHTGRAEADPFTSMAQPQLVLAPKTWLLARAAPS